MPLGFRSKPQPKRMPSNGQIATGVGSTAVAITTGAVALKAKRNINHCAVLIKLLHETRYLREKADAQAVFPQIKDAFGGLQYFPGCAYLYPKAFFDVLHREKVDSNTATDLENAITTDLPIIDFYTVNLTGLEAYEFYSGEGLKRSRGIYFLLDLSGQRKQHAIRFIEYNTTRQKDNGSKMVGFVFRDALTRDSKVRVTKTIVDPFKALISILGINDPLSFPQDSAKLYQSAVNSFTQNLDYVLELTKPTTVKERTRNAVQNFASSASSVGRKVSTGASNAANAMRERIPFQGREAPAQAPQ